MITLDMNKILFSKHSMLIISVVLIIWIMFCCQRTFKALYIAKLILFVTSLLFFIGLAAFTNNTIKDTLSLFIIIWFPLFGKLLLIPFIFALNGTFEMCRDHNRDRF